MRDRDALENNPKVSRKALESLHGDLYGWALSRSGYAPDVAEDLMQEAYVEILSGRAMFAEQSTLKTFLFGVVQNLARGRFRRRATRLRIVDRFASEHPSAVTSDDRCNASHDRIWAAVQALPARQRDITELVFCREMTIEEASTVMGVTVGTGRVHYDRAKKALAAALAELQSTGSTK